MLDFGGRKIVVQSLVGSWAGNLNTPLSDKDWKYFVAPTFEDLYNGKMFSTSSVSDTEDIDCHDIRSLGTLLWKANVNFIVTLFGYELYYDPGLKWVFNNADALSMMNFPYLYNATRGMHYEKMSTLLKGTGNTQVLIEKYGYDTKQACHALRCLYILERIFLGKNVREALWFEDGIYRDTLLQVKMGWYTLEYFKEVVEIWFENYQIEVKQWFENQKPNEELSQELNSRIKEFIRINLN